MGLPTPAQFDAGYDATVAFMTAFRTSPLYPLVRSVVTNDGPMARAEVTDEMADQLGDVLDATAVASGQPSQRRERPFLKAALQKLIESLQAGLAGQGGLGGMLSALIIQLMGDLLNPATPG